MLTNRLREAREALGWSRKMLAEAAATSPQQIARLEGGERILTVPWVNRLAKAMSLEPFELMQPTGSEKHPNLAPMIAWEKINQWEQAINAPIGAVPMVEGGPRTFALRVMPGQFSNVLPTGGVIGIDPDQIDLQPRLRYLIANAEEKFAIRKLNFSPLAFLADGDTLSPWEIRIGSEQFTVIGRVVWAYGHVDDPV